jgi:hypothetical protein
LRGDDPSLFAETLRASIPSFPESATFDPAGVEAVMKVLRVSDQARKLKGLDLRSTYTNEFAATK